MPCNSDHMLPRHGEKLSHETAKLIVFVDEKMLQATPAWIVNAAKEYYDAITASISYQDPATLRRNGRWAGDGINCPTREV